MSELNQYLEGQSRSDDRASEGSFTIASEKAMAKLKSFALQPNEWVLKIVQAAVAGRSEQLRIQQTRKFTQFEFVKSHGLPEVAHLLEALCSPQVSKNLVSREIVIGLRSIMTHQSFEIIWKNGDALEWNRSELQRVERPPQEALLQIRVQHDVLALRPWPYKPSTLLAENHLIRKRALFAPMAVFIDNQELKFEPYAFSKYDKQTHPGGSPRNFLAGFFALKPDGCARLGATPKTRPNRFLKDGMRRAEPFVIIEPEDRVTNDHSFQFFVSYHTDAEGQRKVRPESFRLLWTRLGVVCAEVELIQGEVGGFLCLPGDRFRSELGGLEVVPESPDYEGLTKILSSLTLTLEERVEPLVTNHPSRAQWSDGLDNSICMAVACFLLPVPVVAIVAAPALAIGLFGTGEKSEMRWWLLSQLTTGFKSLRRSMAGRTSLPGVRDICGLSCHPKECYPPR
jgi:hypothetical protein